MIPSAYLQEWSAHTPWPDSRQVEQDLIICRALCDLFNNEQLKGKIAFRGGTAINKLLFGNRSLTEDIAPLLPVGIQFTDDDAITGFGRIWKELIQRLPGEPWKSSQAVIDEIRKSTIPNLLRDTNNP